MLVKFFLLQKQRLPEAEESRPRPKFLGRLKHEDFLQEARSALEC